jgi:hypothetical protein
MEVFMIYRKLIVTGLFMFFAFSLNYGMEVKDFGFPFKGLVYHAIKILNSDLGNVTVTLETKDKYELTYQGKKYKAQLFSHGAIYLEREGQNPLLISFDVNEFRYNGKFRL